jgi:hypothetical protein
LGDDFTSRTWNVAAINLAEAQESDRESGAVPSNRGCSAETPQVLAKRIEQYLASQPVLTEVGIKQLCGLLHVRNDTCGTAMGQFVASGRVVQANSHG